MRLKHFIFGAIIILSFFEAGLAFAQNASSTEATPVLKKPNTARAIWYQPTLEHSQTQGTSIVHLFGRTWPGTPIFADVENATMIRETNPDLKLKPRAILSSVKSDQGGNFELIYELPYGLIQLPIIFNKYVDTSGAPLLLTIEVTEQTVQMNVKISERPVKKKPKEFVNKFEIGLGLGFVSFSETSNSSGFGNHKISDSSFVYPQIEFAKISNDWWLKFDFETISFEKDLRKIQVEARYCVSSSSRNLWLIGAVNQQSVPIVAVDAANTAQFVDVSAIRYSAGFGYYKELTKWSTFTAVTFDYPLSLTVDAGELSYSPKYDFSLYSEIKYRKSDKWYYGALVGIEYGSFGYDLVNSAKNISYKNASATDMTLRSLLTVYYMF